MLLIIPCLNNSLIQSVLCSSAELLELVQCNKYTRTCPLCITFDDVHHSQVDSYTTVVPAFNGHFCIQAKVFLHGRCPLIGGTGMLEWRAEIRRVRNSHVCHQGATNQQRSPARCSKSKNAIEATVCLQHCLIWQYAVYRAY